MITSENPQALKNRLQSEKNFYDRFYAQGWEKEEQCIDETIVPSNMLVYWQLIKTHIFRLHEKFRQPRVLDCGCGHGVASVLLAKINARVVAVDIAYNSTVITRKFATVNKVDADINVVVAAMEALPFKNGVFDSIIGARVLHHVDVAHSSRELSRVVKDDTKSFFWECTEKNPVLRFARNNIRKFFPAPKFGTKHEHPLTKEEIAALEAAFGNPATVVWAPFYFFSLISQYLSRRHMERLTILGKRLDVMVGKILPGLNRFSFHQILILRKTGKPTKADI